MLGADPSTGGRRGGVILAAAAVCLLAGCAAPAPAPTVSAAPVTTAPAPAPSPTSSAVDLPATVPIASAALPPVKPTLAPATIAVRSVGVRMSIVPVGVLDTGGMQLPENPAVAGWYRYGPDAQASSGSVVIAAHVDSLRYGLGPFVRVRNLPNGTPITITDTSGRNATYLVDRTERVLKHELPTATLFDRSGPRRLVLVTCGGSFDTVSRTYSDNVLVFARLRS